MPFLHLTRDRRGFEHTFLMHADRPGDRPRLLYWYRTAPGIVLGRAALDEDAIRTIEEQHPDIDFDWPAILALREVMTPEEEAPAPRRERRSKPPRQRDQSRERTPSGERREPARAADDTDQDAGAAELSADLSADLSAEGRSAKVEAQGATADDADNPDLISRSLELSATTASTVPSVTAAAPSLGASSPTGNPLPGEAGPAEGREATRPSANALLEELVGREIAARLRARYGEICARVQEQYADALIRDAWLKRADPLNPDLWVTPQAVLEGVRHADALFERLRSELLDHSSRE